MKGIVFCLLGLLIGVESSGQLVRRKDYDLAVALQAGGGTSVGIPFRDVRMFVVPVGGLKMTIPFTRKWFLGTEVNYADHRFDSRYAPGENTDRKQKVRFRLKELQLPVYLTGHLCFSVDMPVIIFKINPGYRDRIRLSL